MLDMIIPALKVKISGDLFERLVFKTLKFVCFFVFAFHFLFVCLFVFFYISCRLFFNFHQISETFNEIAVLNIMLPSL